MIGVVDTMYSPKWIVDGDLNADFTSNEQLVEFYSEVTMQFSITATSTPAGSLYIQSSSDNSRWDNIYIDANKVHGTIDGAAAAHAGGFAIAIAGSGNSQFTVSLSDGIPRYVRCFWDSTSGGAVDTFDATLTARG